MYPALNLSIARPASPAIPREHTVEPSAPPPPDASPGPADPFAGLSDDQLNHLPGGDLFAVGLPGHPMPDDHAYLRRLRRGMPCIDSAEQKEALVQALLQGAREGAADGGPVLLCVASSPASIGAMTVEARLLAAVNQPEGRDLEIDTLYVELPRFYKAQVYRAVHEQLQALQQMPGGPDAYFRAEAGGPEEQRTRVHYAQLVRFAACHGMRVMFVDCASTVRALSDELQRIRESPLPAEAQNLAVRQSLRLGAVPRCAEMTRRMHNDLARGHGGIFLTTRGHVLQVQDGLRRRGIQATSVSLYDHDLQAGDAREFQALASCHPAAARASRTVWLGRAGSGFN